MAGAKIIRVADLDETEWFNIPGSTGDLSREKDAANDTIFGASWTSEQPTLINWSVSADAFYRGFAGYRSVLRRMGTSTAFTSQAMEVEDGQTYIVTDLTQTPWNWNETLTVSDDGVAVDSDDIVEIDPLFGRVTFAEDYVVSGAVTVTGERYPLETFGNANAFDLTQTADTTETTSFEIAQANGGFMTMRPTLRTASLSLTAFYRSDNDFDEPLREDEQFIVEIDPAGNGETLARGIYRVQTNSQSGDVGGDEESNVDLVLSVPEGFVPFSWYFEEENAMPAGLRLILQSYLARENIMVEYLPEGLGEPGNKGEVVITDTSLSSEVNGIVEASIELQGTGALTEVNVA